MKVFNGAIALACAVATTAAYAADVKEVGSFHVGGQQLTGRLPLSGDLQFLDDGEVHGEQDAAG